MRASTTVTMPRCHSKIPWALTAMRCIRLVGCHGSGKHEVDVSSALVLAAEPTICGARAALTEPDYKMLERYRDANNNSLPGTAI
jgi:hypothetical protein